MHTDTSDAAETDDASSAAPAPAAGTESRPPQDVRPRRIAPDGYGDSDHDDADATGVDLPVLPPQHP
jgi:hypothetical protein